VAHATFNVYEAKTRFSQLLRRVIDGDEIVIAKAGMPIARLVKFDTVLVQDRRLGELGRILEKKIREAEFVETADQG
jgi:prevent-host-death family protein